MLFLRQNKPKCIKPIFTSIFLLFSTFFMSKTFWLLFHGKNKIEWFSNRFVCGDTDLYLDSLFVGFRLACLLSICWLNGGIMGFKFRFPLHIIALQSLKFRQVKRNYCFATILNLGINIKPRNGRDLRLSARAYTGLLIGLVWHSNFFHFRRFFGFL